MLEYGAVAADEGLIEAEVGRAKPVRLPPLVAPASVAPPNQGCCEWWCG